MTVPLRSHASVRSYYFREALYQRDCEILTDGRVRTLSDFRPLWREANCRALTWRRQATNIFNPATKQWEQRT